MKAAYDLHDEMNPAGLFAGDSKQPVRDVPDDAAVVIGEAHGWFVKGGGRIPAPRDGRPPRVLPDTGLPGPDSASSATPVPATVSQAAAEPAAAEPALVQPLLAEPPLVQPTPAEPESKVESSVAEVGEPDPIDDGEAGPGGAAITAAGEAELADWQVPGAGEPRAATEWVDEMARIDENAAEARDVDWRGLAAIGFGEPEGGVATSAGAGAVALLHAEPAVDQLKVDRAAADLSQVDQREGAGRLRLAWFVVVIVLLVVVTAIVVVLWQPGRAGGFSAHAAWPALAPLLLTPRGRG